MIMMGPNRNALQRLIWLRGNPAISGGGGSPLTVSGPTPLLMPGAVAKPLRAATFAIEAVQAGTGDPSPTNIRAITGHQSMTAWVTGKNLLNPEGFVAGKYITASGVLISGNTNIATENFYYLAPNTVYTVSTNNTMFNIGICLYKSDKSTVISRTNNNNTSTVTIQSSTENRYLRCWFDIDSNTTMTIDLLMAKQPQLNIGSTPTAYEPFSGETAEVDFGGTVYSGTVDPVTGQGVVDGVLETFDTVVSEKTILSVISSFNKENGSVAVTGDVTRITFSIRSDVDRSNYNLISNTSAYEGRQWCNMAPHIFSYSNESVHWYRNTSLMIYLPTSIVGSTSESVFNWLVSIKDTTPLSVWLPLDTPIPFTVTPQSLTPPAGDAYIWADCGASAEVTYIGKA